MPDFAPGPETPSMHFQEPDRARLEELLRQTRLGDKAARNDLVAGLWSFIKHKVRYCLNAACRQNQSDVAQSVLRRLLTKEGASLPPTSLQLLAYVGIMARNRCNDAWREFLRRPGRLSSPNDVAARPDAQETWDRRDEIILLVLCALEGLSERERQVLELTCYDGMSTAEIATRMGTSEGAVRVLRHRATTKVELLVEKKLLEESDEH